jgi:hypothetical protein
MRYRRFAEYFFLVSFFQNSLLKAGTGSDGFYGIHNVKFIGLNFYYHLVSIV